MQKLRTDTGAIRDDAKTAIDQEQQYDHQTDIVVLEQKLTQMAKHFLTAWRHRDEEDIQNVHQVLSSLEDRLDHERKERLNETSPMSAKLEQVGTVHKVLEQGRCERSVWIESKVVHEEGNRIASVKNTKSFLRRGSEISVTLSPSLMRRPR